MKHIMPVGSTGKTEGDGSRGVVVAIGGDRSEGKVVAPGKTF